MKMAVFWVAAPCSLEEVYQCFRGPCCLHHQGDESLVNFYQTTQRNNPADSHLHTRRRENLKSHTVRLNGLIVAHLVKNVPAVYETQRFIIVFTSAHHCTLSQSTLKFCIHFSTPKGVLHVAFAVQFLAKNINPFMCVRARECLCALTCICPCGL
jgi:hypothetical protein